MDSATVHLSYRTEQLRAEAATRRLVESTLTDAPATRSGAPLRRVRLLTAAGFALALVGTIATTVLAIPGPSSHAPGGGVSGSVLLHR